MPRINQKHGIPRFQGESTFSLSRGRFLGGTAPCYFGPGQPPNAAPEPGVIDLTGTEADLVYSPPDDWPGAGSLLRVPQCVYLSALLADYGKTTPYEYKVLPSIGDPYATVTPYDHTIPPIYHDEYVRLKGVFDVAKATIESLRPGRTWVQNVDWLPPSWEHPIGFRANNVHYACRTRGCLHMIAPPEDAGDYFGVDFLHVYAGMKAFDQASFSRFGYGYMRFIADDLPTPPEDDFNHQLARPRVVAAWPKFRDYAVKLYGVNLPYTPMPPYTDSVITPLYAGNLSIQAAIDSDNTTERLGVAGFNANFLAVRDDSNGFLAASAADMADYGFSYDGVTSDLTAESLVSLIADHFGFDPGTGRDVG